MVLNSKNTKKILLIILFGVFIFTAFQNFGIVLNILNKILSVFSPVITAFCIAFVLNVLLRAIETKLFKFWDKTKYKFLLKLKRPICLIITYILALGLISLLMLVIIPELVDTITSLAEKMPDFALKVRDWIDNFLMRFNIESSNVPNFEIDWNAVSKTIIDWVSGSSGKIVNSAVNITSTVFSGVFDTIFSVVISIYVLAQKEKIGAFIKRFFNAFATNKVKGFVYYISSKTSDSFSQFIGGQFTEAVILGTLCFIGMLIFRMPNSLIISVLIGVSALVPVVGATVGTLIGFLLIVITDPLKAFLFVLFILILQQLEGNLIYPRVVGKAVGLPGILVVSAVLIGGNIGGVLGALVAVPTVAVLFTLLKEMMTLSTPKNRTVIPTDLNTEETTEDIKEDTKENHE